MKRNAGIILAVLLIAALFISGCSNGEKDDRGVSGTVAGVVTDSATGNPIEGATVKIGTLSAVTNSKGQYGINSVPDGKQEITAVMEGYQNYSDTVDVFVGEVTLKNISMTPAAAESGNITGAVTDGITDAPVAGAVVTIGGLSDTTGEDGIYTINGIAAGADLPITASATGYQAYAGTVTITSGETLTHDFPMAPYDEVTETNPADGATEVPTDEPITVTFRNNIEEGADFTGITVNDGTGDIATTNTIAGNVLTITPDARLDNGTVYTVTIPAAAVDGIRAMEEDFSFSFTTDTVRTIRVSVASDGTQGNGESENNGCGVVSADGRFTVFDSDASNLVAGDTNLVSDVFVHDRETGETARVSIASDGTQGNGYSSHASISPDGRFVAFFSEANNLVTGDTNGRRDIFVHDRQTGETTRVSVDSDGVQGNNHSYYPSLSSDGRYVAFYSYANNLVAGDTNGYSDVFVHDRQTGETTRVSVASDGSQGIDGGSLSPSISADGRFVAFESNATNLVAGDTNGFRDIFVHDRQTGETTRVSVASDGTQGDGEAYKSSISADGRFVTFESDSTNLVTGDTNGFSDIFVHDRQTAETARVSVASDGTQGNENSYQPSISADGRHVIFESRATNLVTGDTNGFSDIFVHDRQTGVTTRVSVASDGTQGNGGSNNPSISSDGQFVTFYSEASNLVENDTNGLDDVFIRNRW